MALDKKVSILIVVFVGSVLIACGIGALSFIIYPNPATKEPKPMPVVNRQSVMPVVQAPARPDPEPSITEQIFNPIYVENIAYIKEDSLIKLPDMGLQILFPPSTSISNAPYIRIVTADSITQKLQSYIKIIDELTRNPAGVEPPTYEVDTMDIKFFNQEKINFAARKSFTYHGRSDVGGEENYTISARKIGGRWFLVYDMYLVFDNNFRAYSTFIGDKRLDILLPLPAREDSIKEAEAMFSQIKIMPFNPNMSYGSPNTAQLQEKDLQEGKLYSGHNVEMVRNDQEGMFKLKVHPKLPAYIFRIFSANQNQKGQIEIYTSSKSTKPRQIIAFDPNLWRAQEAPVAFAVNDINFDGFLDIGLLADGGAKFGSFQYWTFDPRVGLFVTSLLAQEFRGLGFNDIKFDAKNKRITTTNFEGPLLALKQVYTVEKGHLKLIEEYHQEQGYEDNKLIGKCTITVKKYTKAAIPEVSTEIINENCTGYSLEE